MALELRFGKTTQKNKMLFAGLVMLSGILSLAGCAQQPTKNERTPVAPASTTEPPLLPVALRVGHPQSYTVAPGDNIWDISSQFLEQPWRWPEMWEQQKQLPGTGNVVSLYPGDVIKLSEHNGQAQLQLASGERSTIKLSPQIRIEEISRPVPTIRRDAVAPFIQDSMVLPAAEWQQAAYILGNADGNMVTLAGSRIYARGDIFDQTNYRIFRPGKEYRDPVSNASLGFELRYIGEAALEQDTDPAVLRLISADRELRPGDRLFPLEPEPLALNFDPVAVPEDTSGQIVGSLPESLLIKRYSNVVINLGEFDGIQPGHVFAVYQPGVTVPDVVAGGSVQLPERRSGLIMIYKSFDLVSYGLVTESAREIRVFDRVGEP